LIDADLLLKTKDNLVKEIGQAYLNYRKFLLEYNKIDFSLIQRYFFDLLKKTEAGQKIINTIKYVLVDEYQDTNFVQEQLLFKLSSYLFSSLA